MIDSVKDRGRTYTVWNWNNRPKQAKPDLSLVIFGRTHAAILQIKAAAENDLPGRARLPSFLLRPQLSFILGLASIALQAERRRLLRLPACSLWLYSLVAVEASPS